MFIKEMGRGFTAFRNVGPPPSRVVFSCYFAYDSVDFKYFGVKYAGIIKAHEVLACSAQIQFRFMASVDFADEMPEVIMNKQLKTDFLFAQPSFLSGTARLVDMWGKFDDYNSSSSPSEADAKAIATDWMVVGQDLYDAIDILDKEEQQVA